MSVPSNTSPIAPGSTGASLHSGESLFVENFRRDLETAHALQLDNFHRELRDAHDREMAIQATRHEKAMQSKCEELEMAVRRERDAVERYTQRTDGEMRLMTERGEKLRKENHDLKLKLRQLQQQLREEQQNQDRLREQIAATQRGSVHVTDPSNSSLKTTSGVRTIEDLETCFPALVANLRNTLTSENSERFSKSTARILEQCTKAYDNAVAKLMAGCAKLEKRLTEKLKNEKDVEIARLNAKWQAEIAERDEESRTETGFKRWESPNANQSRNDWEESEKVINLEKTLATMKSDMAALRRQHSTEMEALEERHREAQKLAIEKIKAQFLSTLKIVVALWDQLIDVAASKARAAERTEEEWRKRKRRLDEEWERRFSDLKDHYDTELSRLVPSIPSVASGGQPYAKIPSPHTKSSSTQPLETSSKPPVSKPETSRKSPVARPDPSSVGSKLVTILSAHLSAAREPTDIRLLSPSSLLSPDSKTLARATRHSYC